MVKQGAAIAALLLVCHLFSGQNSGVDAAVPATAARPGAINPAYMSLSAADAAAAGGEAGVSPQLPAGSSTADAQSARNQQLPPAIPLALLMGPSKFKFSQVSVGY